MPVMGRSGGAVRRPTTRNRRRGRRAEPSGKCRGAGGEATTLVAAIGEREGRRDALARELESLEAAQDSAPFDMWPIERDLRARLDVWRGLLRRRVVQARQILRKLLESPVVFTPVIEGEERFYRFHATVRFDRLIAGFALPQVLTSPRGSDTGVGRGNPRRYARGVTANVHPYLPSARFRVASVPNSGVVAEKP
jgi:hypothetical protein